jgi:hypothetical protein
MQIKSKGIFLFRFLALFLSLLLFLQQSGFSQLAAELDISTHLATLRNSLTVEKFRPLHLRYLSLDSQSNNLRLLLDKGDLKDLKEEVIQNTAAKLLEYFFIGLNLPNDKFWVNLRPDSPDNIIDPLLAQTDIGKILLESDLQLKKDTAQATNPQTPEGKLYWERLYKKAEELFGSENIAIPTLTRPWIVPDEIIIRETMDSVYTEPGQGPSRSAYIYKATLKVMLEEDYLKEKNHLPAYSDYTFKDPRLKLLNEYACKLIQELILPKLNKELNSSQHYAPLRQVYYSLILAQWFKARNQGRDNPYSAMIDRQDLTSLTAKEYYSKDDYFKEYQKSFKVGEYNLQAPVYTPFSQVIRSYFSGGINLAFTIPNAQGVTVGDSSKICFIPANKQSGEHVFSEKTISLGAHFGNAGQGFVIELPSALNLSLAANRAYPETPASKNAQANQIGKQARIEKVILGQGNQPIALKVKDSQGRIQQLALRWQGLIDVNGLKKKFDLMIDLGESQRKIILTILNILEKSPPLLFTFDSLIDDLFGFASSRYNFLALHTSLEDNPIALFHEIGEYLIDSGQIKLEFSKNQITITNQQDNNLITIKLYQQDALRQVQKGHPRPHYLLRALAREIFTNSDRELSYIIRQRLIIDESLTEKLAQLMEGLRKENDPEANTISANSIIHLISLPDFPEALFSEVAKGLKKSYRDGGMFSKYFVVYVLLELISKKPKFLNPDLVLFLEEVVSEFDSNNYISATAFEALLKISKSEPEIFSYEAIEKIKDIFKRYNPNYFPSCSLILMNIGVGKKVEDEVARGIINFFEDELKKKHQL